MKNLYRSTITTVSINLFTMEEPTRKKPRFVVPDRDENMAAEVQEFLKDYFDKGGHRQFALPSTIIWSKTTTPYSDFLKVHQTQIDSPKKKTDGHTDRVLNCFFLWSKMIRPVLNKLFLKVNQQNVSKMLGQTWKALPLSEKNVFVDEAQVLRNYFNQEFPSYKYQPKRKRSAGETSVEKQHNEGASQRGPNKRGRAFSKSNLIQQQLSQLPQLTVDTMNINTVGYSPSNSPAFSVMTPPSHNDGDLFNFNFCHRKPDNIGEFSSPLTPPSPFSTPITSKVHKKRSSSSSSSYPEYSPPLSCKTSGASTGERSAASTEERSAACTSRQAPSLDFSCASPISNPSSPVPAATPVCPRAASLSQPLLREMPTKTSSHLTASAVGQEGVLPSTFEAASESGTPLAPPSHFSGSANISKLPSSAVAATAVAAAAAVGPIDVIDSTSLQAFFKYDGVLVVPPDSESMSASDEELLKVLHDLMVESESLETTPQTLPTSTRSHGDLTSSQSFSVASSSSVFVNFSLSDNDIMNIPLDMPDDFLDDDQ